jgi:hypothetical protein
LRGLLQEGGRGHLEHDGESKRCVGIEGGRHGDSIVARKRYRAVGMFSCGT